MLHCGALMVLLSVNRAHLWTCSCSFGKHETTLDSLCSCVLCAFPAYPPLYPNFPVSAMDTPFKYHEQELSYAGIDLPALLASGKKVGGTCSSIQPVRLLQICTLRRKQCMEGAQTSS